MMPVLICETSDQLELRIRKISILASILNRKARELSEQLSVGDLAYNPYSRKALGRKTEDLELVSKLGQEIGELAVQL